MDRSHRIGRSEIMTWKVAYTSKIQAPRTLEQEYGEIETKVGQHEDTIIVITSFHRRSDQ